MDTKSGNFAQHPTNIISCARRLRGTGSKKLYKKQLLWFSRKISESKGVTFGKRSTPEYYLSVFSVLIYLFENR